MDDLRRVVQWVWRQIKEFWLHLIWGIPIGLALEILSRWMSGAAAILVVLLVVAIFYLGRMWWHGRL